MSLSLARQAPLQDHYDDDDIVVIVLMAMITVLMMSAECNNNDDQPSVSCLNQRTLGGGKARILQERLVLSSNLFVFLSLSFIFILFLSLIFYKDLYL